jgi:hypothetical protein
LGFFDAQILVSAINSMNLIEELCEKNPQLAFSLALEIIQKTNSKFSSEMNNALDSINQ